MSTLPPVATAANPHFARSALTRHTQRDFVGLVQKHGIAFYEKTLGQLFCEGPRSSQKIVRMLLDECAAAGVELLHTASLVHDDAVDHSAFRRGKPTLNSQVDTAAVILVGDYLFAQSAILAASTNNPRVVSVFSNSLGDICDGQLMEMMDARKPEQTERQYLARIYGKTASLFGCAAETGAIIGGAPEEAISALRGYGDDLGLAFQIMDDVLDLTGGSETLGKPAGHDLLQSTITLPVIYYLRMVETDGPEWREVQAIVDRSRQDDAFVGSVLEKIRESGAVEQSIERANGYVEQAKRRLDVVPNPETRDLLIELAETTVRRVS